MHGCVDLFFRPLATVVLVITEVVDVPVAEVVDVTVVARVPLQSCNINIIGLVLKSRTVGLKWPFMSNKLSKDLLHIHKDLVLRSITLKPLPQPQDLYSVALCQQGNLVFCPILL